MPTTKQTLERILGEVRGKKEGGSHEYSNDDADLGYNQALSDVEQLLLAEIKNHE